MKIPTTDVELLKWADKQRRLYHRGKLSDSKVKKLEAIPGWSWNIGYTPTMMGIIAEKSLTTLTLEK